MQTQEISAEQARRNMQMPIENLDDAIAALNDAIRTASQEHRGHTTVFMPRASIGQPELAQIKKRLTRGGFKVEDRCHDCERFALQISWYPG